jgi:hypothetical protein
VEKYGTARKATDENIIRRMRFACWITKATGRHSEYLHLLLFHGNIGYANVPHRYVYMYIASLVFHLKVRIRLAYEEGSIFLQ